MAPLVDRMYLDLKTKKIVGIKPKPGFGEILAQAAQNTTSATAVLLGQDELQQFPNVGMVETGESRTPRPVRCKGNTLCCSNSKMDQIKRHSITDQASRRCLE